MPTQIRKFNEQELCSIILGWASLGKHYDYHELEYAYAEQEDKTRSVTIYRSSDDMGMAVFSCDRALLYLAINIMEEDLPLDQNECADKFDAFVRMLRHEDAEVL